MSPLALLECLYSEIPYYDGSSCQAEEVQRELFSDKATAKSSHLSPLRGVYKLPFRDDDVAEKETELAVFEYEKYSLQDVLKYNRHVLHDDEDAQVSTRSPSVVNDFQCFIPTNRLVLIQGEELALSDMKKRFLVYQLHQILQFLDQQGLACGGFTPSNILLTDTLWIRLGSLPFAQKTAREITTKADAVERGPHKRSSPSLDSIDAYRTVSSFSSRSVTEQWCDGDLSNFDYLMLLNEAAGRRMVSGALSCILSFCGIRLTTVARTLPIDRWRLSSIPPLGDRFPLAQFWLARPEQEQVPAQ